MKRILFSLMTLGAVGGIALAATGAFFSDSETSTGNTFEAGAIDLRMSSHAYSAIGGDLTADENLNWQVNSIGDEVFFNYNDIKPGDWGENTIDYEVYNNDAWVCANVSATDNENDVVDPEADASDVTDNTDPAYYDGELSQYLQFIWWADDGDNVLEDDEHLAFSQTPLTLAQMLGEDGSVDLTLADSSWNWETESASGPIPGETPKYIGVGWCFGNISLSQVSASSNPLDPTVDGAGFICDGTNMPDVNIAQTDSIDGTLSFEAVQTRNNPSFLCSEHAD